MRQPSRISDGVSARRSGPASSSSTERDPESASRAATTQPAAPPPTMTTSNIDSVQSGCSLVGLGERRPGLRRLDLDDLVAHRSEQAAQLLLLRRRNVELVERCDEILDERVELARSDLHSVVCLQHAATGVGAGTACRLADLIDEHLLQPRHIGPNELLVDPVIAGTARNEGIHDRRNRVEAAESLIQRRHRYLPTLPAGGSDATTAADAEQARKCDEAACAARHEIAGA